MRWIKHLALASKDEKISALIDRCGLEGYGLYWIILETIAVPMEQGNQRCDLIYSEGKWAQELRCSVRKLRNVLPVMAELELISVRNVDDRPIISTSSADDIHIIGTSSGNRIQIVVPNLLKYRDEWSKRSGVTHEQDIEVDTDTEAEKNKDIDTPPVRAKLAELKPKVDEVKEWFDSQFWPMYPKHVGKPAALAKARTKAKTETERAEIMFGLQVHLQDLLAKESQYRPNPATWLHQERWKDPPEQRSRDSPRKGSYETPTDRAIRIGHERILETGRL